MSKLEYGTYAKSHRRSQVKMNTFMLRLLVLVGLTPALTKSEQTICIPEGETMNCICRRRENITLNTIIVNEATNLSVKGCGTVHVPLGSIIHPELDQIEIVDAINLYIQPFAFAVTRIKTLKIADIQNFNVASQGFSGLYSLENIIIRNVTTNSLSIGAFSGISDVQYFLIEDSEFYEVQQTAFILSNISTFRVANSVFDSIQNISFLVHISEEVLFENCYFGKTLSSSFVISQASSFTFHTCKFDVLAPNAVDCKELQSFHFINCTVEELQTDAFSLIDISEKITFTHNIFEIAGENAFASQNVSLKSIENEYEYCCNAFTCNCDIFWMWNSYAGERYDSLLQSSQCIGEKSNTSELNPVLDSSGNCMTLENIFTKTTAKSLLKSSPLYPTSNDITSHEIFPEPTPKPFHKSSQTALTNGNKLGLILSFLTVCFSHALDKTVFSKF